MNKATYIREPSSLDNSITESIPIEDSLSFEAWFSVLCKLRRYDSVNETNHADLFIKMVPSTVGEADTSYIKKLTKHEYKERMSSLVKIINTLAD